MSDWVDVYGKSRPLVPWPNSVGTKAHHRFIDLQWCK